MVFVTLLLWGLNYATLSLLCCWVCWQVGRWAEVNARSEDGSRSRLVKLMWRTVPFYMTVFAILALVVLVPAGVTTWLCDDTVCPIVPNLVCVLVSGALVALAVLQVTGSPALSQWV